MRNKYNDNKLAEEFDLIVLTNDALAKNGLPCGSLGTLTYSYTGGNAPLFGEFAFADGTRKETPLSLHCFRVLNANKKEDLHLLSAHLCANARKKA